MPPVAPQRLLARLRRHLAAARRRRAARQVEALLPLLAAIADPDLRLHRVGEHLAARSAPDAAWTLARLYELTCEGDRRAQQVCLGLLDLHRLSRVLPTAHLVAMGDALREAGHRSAALLCEERRPADGGDDEVFPRSSEPVGSRISLARRPAPTVIERLLYDPDPRVLATLLGNPRLTEAEVVKLAAARRVAPEALAAIARDARWVARYAVKLALAGNPATPLRVILALLPYLLRQDLRALAGRAPRPEVRLEAARLLARESQAGSGAQTAPPG
jgi:hypothetical protein